VSGSDNCCICCQPLEAPYTPEYIQAWYLYAQVNQRTLLTPSARLQVWRDFAGADLPLPLGTDYTWLPCSHAFHEKCFFDYVVAAAVEPKPLRLALEQCGEPTTLPYVPNYAWWVLPHAAHVPCPLCRQVIGMDYITECIHETWSQAQRYWCYDQAYSPEHSQAGSYVTCMQLTVHPETLLWYAHIRDVITQQESAVPVICLFTAGTHTLPTRTQVAQRLTYLLYTQTLLEGPLHFTQMWLQYAQASRQQQMQMYLKYTWPSTWFTQRLTPSFHLVQQPFVPTPNWVVLQQEAQRQGLSLWTVWCYASSSVRGSFNDSMAGSRIKL